MSNTNKPEAIESSPLETDTIESDIFEDDDGSQEVYDAIGTLGKAVFQWVYKQF